jgi:DEAD/DEAH box helicase domain-containing protein
LDPIGGFYRIRDFFISYLETAFRIRNEGVSRERRSILETHGTLCAEPLIEPIPKYERVDFMLHDLSASQGTDPRLPGFSREECIAFVDLALAGLFDAEPDPTGASSGKAKYRIYHHQHEMLVKGVTPGSPGVVTSGTGSGKTEAFLLPILAMLAKEGTKWIAPASGYLKKRWWQKPDGSPFEKYTQLPDRPMRSNKDGSPFCPQREGEHPDRPKAVRALILYPMNALVEDQMIRIRRALDSDRARNSMDRHLRKNRIFFARYTGDTKVTGFHRHPRPGDNEHEKRKAKLEELFNYSKELQLTQEAAKRFDEAKDEDQKIRYLFPTIDGGELSSRWDIQATPPDILITNVSMLSAMLVREVDAPVLDMTREWIKGNDDAYFFLVLDELHLQRGSAGTEVSYLIRLLLERLGLSDPRHRHKLRILSSSASLPMEGPERKESLEYLWDMFGKNGTRTTREKEVPDPKRSWEAAVIPGNAVKVVPSSTHRLPVEPFEALLGKSTTSPNDVAELDAPNAIESEWRAIHSGLFAGRSPGKPSLRPVVEACVKEASLRLAAACWDEDSRRARATSLSVLADRLFGEKSDHEQKAVHGLMLVCGAGDYFAKWWPDGIQVPDDDERPSFRVHCFFRSIDGLFAAADADGQTSVRKEFRAPGRNIGPLHIERGTRFSPGCGGEIGNRVVELLYCEACGELFFGGIRDGRGGGEVELLPAEPDVEGLPDRASRQFFEETTANNFAVLWPAPGNRWLDSDPDTAPGRWIKALFDPATAVANVLGVTPVQETGKIRVYLYHVPPASPDSHGRTVSSPGSSVPYECPSCGSDYSNRKRDQRLSPIRNFRTGFAKTTQLLATDLFSLLRLDEAGAKLVSFSDSRQDAAKAALDIENRHHEDLRREILVECLAEILAGRPDKVTLERKVGKLREEMKAVAMAGDFGRMNEIMAVLNQAERALLDAQRDDIAVSEILERAGASRDYHGITGDGRSPLKPLIGRFAGLGIHPVSPTGVKKIKGYHWFDLFIENNGRIDWLDGDARSQIQLNDARDEIVRKMHLLMSDVIFSKTYFALEETGLGYPCVPASFGGRILAEEERNQLNAFVRVFGDAYRTLFSPWEDPRNPRKAWLSSVDITSQRNRVRKFAAARWPAGPDRVLDEMLEALREAGHRDGFINLDALAVKLVGTDDPFWRCPNCGRVHLHKGVGLCTRCYVRLPKSPTGKTAEVRASHYIAKRIERIGEAFRLRCEELTGQTEDPADRQRRFKGLVVNFGNGRSEPLKGFRRDAMLVDLLAVTTTMEVGVDIGPLKSVFQANMPPQRFNYQQRVGRAGRRRMAFSMVVTVCRSRSHDLHYFRHPERITGDSPPPPFLTKRQPNSVKRFMRKIWLCQAFSILREKHGVGYPGDSMVPPDIHGEFVPSEVYFDETLGWKDRLKEELEATRDRKRRIVDFLTADSSLGNHPDLVGYDVEDLLGDIEKVRKSDLKEPGLAHRLAEKGYFPMYGMPTRVRNLYLGLGLRRENSRAWSHIDRDLDIAIYEFAPESVIVKDKMHHRCVGFTGAFEESPFPFGDEIVPLGDAFSDPFWLVQCEHCGSWRRLHDRPEGSTIECRSCRSNIDPVKVSQCRTPNAFRSDFWPSLIDDQPPKPSVVQRSIKAEEVEVNLCAASGTNMRLECQQQTTTYRLNRGRENRNAGGGWAGFRVIRGSHKIRDGKRDRKIVCQYIMDGMEGDVRLEPDGLALEQVWLAAPKVTDSLFIAPVEVPKGLWINRVFGGAMGVAGVRAAAISATFILMNRAALALDIDPEEFDLIEPRI